MSKKFRTDPKTAERRKRVAKRLENQLLTGHKIVRMETGELGSVKLSEPDRNRIVKEIEVLKTRY